MWNTNIFILVVGYAVVLLLPSTDARLWGMKPCSPSAEGSNCPPNPGFGGNITFGFSRSSKHEDFEEFWTLDPQSEHDWLTIDTNTENKGAALKVIEPLRGPTLSSKKYLMFGKVAVELQAAPGNGVITAIVLKSDSGNKIDWEILGAYDRQARSNYFFDGRPVYDQYADTYDLDFSTTSDFHTYSIEWSDTFLVFSVDGKELKTWRNGDIPGDQWPQLPMQVKVGVWAVTENSALGEIEWAGGVPNWEQDAPFVAYYRKLVVEDYAAWCRERSGNITYDWDDGARWEDVRLPGCERRGGSGFFPDEDDPWTTLETEQPSAKRTWPNESQDVSSKAPSRTVDSNDAERTTTSGTAEPSDTGADEEDIASLTKASGLFGILASLVWIFAF